MRVSSIIRFLFLIHLLFFCWNKANAQTAPLTWNIESIYTPTCLAYPNGKMVVKVNCENGTATLFLKSKFGLNIGYNPPYTFQNLRPANYELWIIHSPSNWMSDTIQLLLSDSQVLNATVQPLSLPNCYSDSSYSFKVNASKGVPPYLYKLLYDTISYESPIFSKLLYKPYWISIMDSIGCNKYVKGPDSLINPLKIKLKWKRDISCINQTDGILHFEATGGKPPYQVTWTEFPGYYEFYKTNLSTGWYQIQLEDSIKCASTTRVFLPIRYIINKVQFCSANQKLGSNHVTLTWSTNSLEAPKEFLLYRSREYHGEVDIIARISPFDSLQYTDTSVLASDGPWYYGMKVLDSCGNLSGYSSVTRSALGEAKQLGEEVNLFWTPYLGRAGVSQYILKRINQGNWVMMDSVTPFIQEWKDTSSFSLGRKEYLISWQYLEACNSMFPEMEVYSNIIEPKKVSGIKESEFETFVINPNPATNYLKLQLSKRLSLTNYRIVDISGIQIQEGALNENLTIPVDTIGSGIFLLFLYNKSNQQLSQRFIKL